MRVFTHPIMAQHEVPEGMPENAQRYNVLRQMIESHFPDISIEESRKADDAVLRLAHSQRYIESIDVDDFTMIDGDTYLSPHSFQAASHAVGAALDAVDAVLDGTCETAFALTRPPGHHASAKKAEGFCLFNAVFIAARYAVQRNPDINVLIVDFDVHHGNGTEALLQDYLDKGNENIAYASTHQEGIYPGSGYTQSSRVYNYPLLAGASSTEFREAITYDILPFAQRFEPDLILFSAGFDAHEEDPLAGLNFKHEDFAWVVEQFKHLCPKMVSVLEGGYNLDALPVSCMHHLKALRS